MNTTKHIFAIILNFAISNLDAANARAYRMLIGDRQTQEPRHPIRFAPKSRSRAA